MSVMRKSKASSKNKLPKCRNCGKEIEEGLQLKQKNETQDYCDFVCLNNDWNG